MPPAKYGDEDCKTSNGMDIQELKKMLKSSATVLIMDNGEPSLVVVNYQTYKDLVSEKTAEEEKEIKVHASAEKQAGPGEVELLERINKDILALKAQIEDEEKTVGGSQALHID